jgi:CopG family nickel-responsive transcriptional regulator
MGAGALTVKYRSLIDPIAGRYRQEPTISFGRQPMIDHRPPSVCLSAPAVALSAQVPRRLAGVETNIREETMQRITITIDDELMEDVDRLIARRGYQNRSEALRDLARAGIAQDRQRSNQRGDCVAAVVYVYDHAARDLSRRLVKEMHGHHELTLATMHVHLDEKSCLEVNVLKGAINRVEHLADHIIAERGVRHGNLVMIPIDREHPHRRHKGAHQHA